MAGQWADVEAGRVVTLARNRATDGAWFTVAPDILTAPELSQLRTEARHLRGAAARRERQGLAVAPDGRMLCALRNWWSGEGVADKALQREALVPRLRPFLPPDLEATHAGYLYYGPGDFLGLHLDHSTCRVTVLVWLVGPTGPLRLHPELTGLGEDDLARVAERWQGHPPEGVDVDLRRGPLVVRGGEVPHDRPPHPHFEELTISTFCFTWSEEEASCFPRTT